MGLLQIERCGSVDTAVLNGTIPCLLQLDAGAMEESQWSPSTTGGFYDGFLPI